MPTLNEKIITYLTVNNIKFTNADYQTGQPEGQPDQILFWNTESLGAEPTQTQLDEAYVIWEGQQTAKQNKIQAEILLKESDWSQHQDVTNPANVPHLTNGDAWMFYRLELRSIAINPPATAITWPVKPEEQWSTQ